MKSTMMTAQLSTNHILERAGKYFGRNEVVGRLPDKSLYRRSYAEIHRRARQLAQALQRRGIERGEAVATLCWNHAWHLEAYFGIPAAGAVLHTLNLRLAPEELAYIIENAEDKAILVDDVLLPIWEKVRPLLKTAPDVIVVPYSGAAVPDGYENYEDFIAADASGFRYIDQDENEAVGMCYTSGTTGRPKGVVYSHRSMVMHAVAGCMPNLFSVANGDRILLVTPMFHANAWALPFSALMVGANLIMPGPHMQGDDLLELMEKEKINTAVGVPTIWTMLLDTLERAGRERTLDLVKPIKMLVGGAAVPVSMVTNFAKYDMHIVQGWGMTETSPIGSFPIVKPEHRHLPESEQHALRAMQGNASPLVDMRIMDEEGNEQPWDGRTPGEIQVRGPWITGGYHKYPDGDLSKFTADGWLRTGDVGTIDAEGYMRIVDRSKDMIKSGGEWISSVQLENLLVGHPEIADAAVVAIPHPKWDERPLVVAVRRPQSTVDAGALRDYLLPHLARFQVPDDFEFVEALPRTPTGKVLKYVLRDTYKDRKSLSQ